jgi:fructan beta-fructosidase
MNQSKILRQACQALLIFAVMPHAASAAMLGDVESWKQDGNTVTLMCGKPVVRLEFWADDVVRVTMSPDGRMEPKSHHDVPLALAGCCFGRNVLTYDFVNETLDKDKVPVPLNDGVLKLRVLVDRPMFEVVVNDGQSYRTAARIDGGTPLKTITVKTKGGGTTVEMLEVYKMKSIWKKSYQHEGKTMIKLTTIAAVSLLIAGLAIPNAAAAADKTAVDPVAWPESREIKLTGKLLLVPIAKGRKKKGDPQGKLSIRVDGNLVHNVDINLAQKKEDAHWWAYLDMSEYVGKTAVLAFPIPAERAGVALIESSNEERHLLPLYDERMRPQFHNSQKQGWNNDANGMVYYDGEYHLFWQCNPVGTEWGNMYWGHSTSPDMIHWTEQRRALRSFGGDYTPNRHPSMANKNCYSGSAHVDVNNSGGWQTGKEKTMVAVFTDTGCGESLAYSNDRGRNWTYYDKNPVIKHRGRDPKLLWYEPGKHWVIAVYDDDPDKKIGGNVAFYSSTNLKDWTLTSKLSGFFECAEVFELPVDGNKNNTRWVIFAADAKYAIGTFDGKTFTPEHEGKHQLHYGHHSFYASQCFNNTPDGRVVQIGWARIGMGGDMPFNQTFSLPINLTLRTTKDGTRMFANPVEELNTLHDGKPKTLTGKTVTKEAPVSLDVDGELADILVTIRKRDATKAMLTFGRIALTYDFANETLDDVPAPLIDGVLKIRVLVDRPMFEVVANDGQSYRTVSRQPAPIGTVSVKAEGGSVTVESLEVHKMKSIWKK